MKSVCDATLIFKRHIWIKNENVEFTYNNSEIKCVFVEEKDLDKLKIHIVSNSRDEVYYLCLTVFNYLFVALGRVPQISSFIIDNENEIERMPSFYICSQRFDSRDMALFSINNNTLNENILRQIDLIDNQFPILSSLIALHSYNYENICDDHRVNLLIHSMEGYHRRQNPKKVDLKDRLQDILSELKFYDARYKIGICDVYEKSLEELLKNIRNQYSHYFDAGISDFTNLDFVFGFFVISYSYRLKIIKDIGICVEDKFVEEYYCILYDWLNIVKGNKIPFKSNAYKTNYRANLKG